MNTKKEHGPPSEWRDLWDDVRIPAALLGGPALIVAGFIAWLYGIEALLRLLIP